MSELKRRPGAHRRGVRSPRMFPLRARWAVATLAVLVGFALTTGLLISSSAGVPGRVTSSSGTSDLKMSATALQQWRQATATPVQRAEVLSKIQTAFAGVAKVGVGETPTNAAELASEPVAPTPSTSQATLMYTAGVTGTHFWVVLSYADAFRGDIALAGIECTALLVPVGGVWGAAACAGITGLLWAIVNGWGNGNAHGVYADVYWWPPHITWGRW